MAGDASAYAALGLEPGADAAAIEQAYRRLIKLHHPDREGGDGARAAEINRAYRELKAGVAAQDPHPMQPSAASMPQPRWGWTAIAAGLLIGLMSLPLLSDPRRFFRPAVRCGGARASRVAPTADHRK